MSTRTLPGPGRTAAQCTLSYAGIERIESCAGSSFDCRPATLRVASFCDPQRPGTSTSNEDVPGYELTGKETPSSEENRKELSAGWLMMNMSPLGIISSLPVLKFPTSIGKNRS
jgi:hypothetical protein